MFPYFVVLFALYCVDRRKHCTVYMVSDMYWLHHESTYNQRVNKTALAEIWRLGDDAAQFSVAMMSSSYSSSGNGTFSTTSKSTSPTSNITTTSSTSSTLSMAVITTLSSSSADATDVASSALMSDLNSLLSSYGKKTSLYPSCALVYSTTFVAMFIILLF